MAYVYRHIRLDKNEPFYIGIGNQQDYKRAYDYSKNRRNKIWLDIFAKTGYEVDIMFDEISWEQACDKEREFIALYGRKDLKTGTLANMTEGGDGVVGVLFTDEHKRKIGEKRTGRFYSQETRLKMSKSQLGNKKYLLRKTPQEEINKKIGLANKGKIRSEEYKEKIKDYFRINGHPSLGKKASDETKEKIAASRRRSVLQFDLDGNLIKEWNSILDAKKEGYCNAAIWRCIKGVYKHHKKSIWKYKN
jgi:hypothetical protein